MLTYFWNPAKRPFLFLSIIAAAKYCTVNHLRLLQGAPFTACPMSATITESINMAATYANEFVTSLCKPSIGRSKAFTSKLFKLLLLCLSKLFLDYILFAVTQVVCIFYKRH